jgi:hypothetical protein
VAWGSSASVPPSRAGWNPVRPSPSTTFDHGSSPTTASRGAESGAARVAGTAERQIWLASALLAPDGRSADLIRSYALSPGHLHRLVGHNQPELAHGPHDRSAARAQRLDPTASHRRPSHAPERTSPCQHPAHKMSGRATQCGSTGALLCAGDAVDGPGSVKAFEFVVAFWAQFDV